MTKPEIPRENIEAALLEAIKSEAERIRKGGEFLCDKKRCPGENPNVYLGKNLPKYAALLLEYSKYVGASEAIEQTRNFSLNVGGSSYYFNRQSYVLWHILNAANGVKIKNVNIRTIRDEIHSVAREAMQELE